MIKVAEQALLGYLVAGCTGLRRGEMQQLIWSDVRLAVTAPFIDVRAETTKNKRAAIIPLVPLLAIRNRGSCLEGVLPKGSVTTDKRRG